MDTIGDLQGGLEEAERLLGFTVTRSGAAGGP
jgi:rsbT co-antagonist protein RsbR